MPSIAGQRLWRRRRSLTCCIWPGACGATVCPAALWASWRYIFWGLSALGEDVPGWLIPSLYFDYLRSGDARPLKGVFYHNAMDVLAMAALLTHMAQLLADPLNTAVEHGLDVVALGKLFEELGQLDAAVQLYERGLAYNNLPEESYWDTQRRLSLAQRRRGDLAAALEVWRLAAEGRQVYAYVELAKYYEHQARDYGEAARWTQAALDLINAPNFSRYERGQWLADLRHRLARLQRKLGT